MAKERIPIPEDTAARVLFLSDRTCCVCREKRKAVQIHHIDDDPSNNDIDNLGALCLQCHDDTQIKGGFGRKLDAAQVKMFRDKWYKTVAEKRSKEGSHQEREIPVQEASLEAQQDSDADDAPIFPPAPYCPPLDLQELEGLLEEYRSLTDEAMKVNVFAEIKELERTIYGQNEKNEFIKKLLPTMLEFYHRENQLLRTNWLGVIRSFYIEGSDEIKELVRTALQDEFDRELLIATSKNADYVELIQMFHNYRHDFMIRLIDAGVDVWNGEGFRQLDNRISFYQAEVRNPSSLKTIRKHVLDRINRVTPDSEKHRRLEVLYRRMVNDSDSLKRARES